MMTGMMYISPSGIRYDSRLMILAVKLSTMVPIKDPTDVHTWKDEIMRPRYRAGTDSWSELMSVVVSIETLHGL